MKWQVIDREEVPVYKNIMFTDGKEVYAGFLETVSFKHPKDEPEEDLLFFDCFSRGWPENITHWMPLPRPPNE